MRHQPVWSRAILRLMTEQGYRSQAALCAAARKRDIPLRPNTLSNATSPTAKNAPRLDTLVTIAQALDVPLWALWALCCEDYEHRLFTATLERPMTAEHVRQELRSIAQILTQLAEADEPAPVEAPPQMVKRRTA